VHKTRFVRPQPAWLRIAWIGVGGGVFVLALHGATGFGGERTHDFLDNWLSDLAVWATAVVCVSGAVRAERSRAAWLLIGAAFVAWAIGDTIWSLRGDPREIVGISDLF
jgi:hypothetical protein